MRLHIGDDELRDAFRRTHTKGVEPTVSDIVKLYLFLPVDIDVQGRKCEARSALEALLTDSHRVTGRDDEGEVENEEHLGTWLGAMGYLALIDQIGKVVKWTDRPDASGTHFEQILRQHGKSEAEAAAMYGLRNAMVHSYGLANTNAKHLDRQHFFTLNVLGGDPIQYPKTPWDGDPATIGLDTTTTVFMQAVGNLGENLVLDLQESYLRDNASVTLRQDPQTVRAGYFFLFGKPM